MGATADPRALLAFGRCRAKRCGTLCDSHREQQNERSGSFTPHTTAAAKDAHRGANEPAEPRYRRAEEGRIIAEANLIIANTPVEADQLQGYYGADPSRLRVITPGVDTSIFCPVAGVHAENEGSDTRSRIVFAGRPQPLKGPHLLVEALGLLPDDLLVELDIIGRSNSDYEQLLLQRAAQLQVADRVHLRPPFRPVSWRRSSGGPILWPRPHPSRSGWWL